MSVKWSGDEAHRDLRSVCRVDYCRSPEGGAETCNLMPPRPVRNPATAARRKFSQARSWRAPMLGGKHSGYPSVAARCSSVSVLDEPEGAIVDLRPILAHASRWDRRSSSRSRVWRMSSSAFVDRSQKDGDLNRFRRDSPASLW